MTKTTKTSTKRKAVSKKKVEPLEDKWQAYWDSVPDAEATVEQIKAYDRFTWGEEPVNYWKWACIVILLGIVVAMITMTPTINSLFDACVQ